MINNFFKFFSIMLLLTSLSANALPWSTDMWDHPSIKPYEEARPYPENNIRREETVRELSRGKGLGTVLRCGPMPTDDNQSGGKC